MGGRAFPSCVWSRRFTGGKTMIDNDLRAHLVRRAEQSNIDLAKLNIEVTELEEFPYIVLQDTLFQVTCIWDGMLDAEFSITGPYEVNVADWIAEFYDQLAG